MRGLLLGLVLLAGLAEAQPALKRKGPAYMKKGPGAVPPQALERFNRMTPSERREALDKLPPERRQRMERRLEQWANTPESERTRLRGSYQRFQEMPPEKQQEVRQLFRQFSETFDPGRRGRAHAAIRALRTADADQRKKLLESRRLQENFNDEERKLLERMAVELPDPN